MLLYFFSRKFNIWSFFPTLCDYAIFSLIMRLDAARGQLCEIAPAYNIRGPVYALWVMVEWCFVASLINLKLITFVVDVRCVHIVCTRRGQKQLKNWGDMFRSLEMSNCSDFRHRSCRTFELQCGWSRTTRDARKCEKFDKILCMCQSVLGSFENQWLPCGILLVCGEWHQQARNQASENWPHQMTQENSKGKR